MLLEEMAIEIRPIKKEEYPSAHAFQCEYLDQESLNDFVNRVEANPDLYLAAFKNTELVGICYGHPSRKVDTVINLQGIAVNLDHRKNYARKGIGSKLIAEFQQAVKLRGYEKVGVGSADDLKVEHFYLKNGFAPIELVAKNSNAEELVRVQITDYESGKIKQESLRSQYHTKEVIFIFEKSLVVN